jgi:hypothetical protein
MPKRRTIGTNPLDAVVPEPRDVPQPRTPAPAAPVGKERLTVHPYRLRPHAAGSKLQPATLPARQAHRSGPKTHFLEVFFKYLRLRPRL